MTGNRIIQEIKKIKNIKKETFVNKESLERAEAFFTIKKSRFQLIIDNNISSSINILLFKISISKSDLPGTAKGPTKELVCAWSPSGKESLCLLYIDDPNAKEVIKTIDWCLKSNSVKFIQD